MTENDSGAARERIAKVIARSGLCSRRDAERWIADGRVTLNGQALNSPAIVVGPEDKRRLQRIRRMVFFEVEIAETPK